jgi:hypothetical protein
MIYNGLITLRLCGFPFAEIGVVSIGATFRPGWLYDPGLKVL